MDRPVMLAKDWDTSGENGCPSVWLQDGAFLCLGPEVTSRTLTDLGNVQPGETAVRLRPDVVRAALARYDAQAGG